MSSENIAILSIDQGTTSTRTLVFNISGKILFTAQEEFPQIYPDDGWVEHNPEAIWNTALSTLKKAYNYTKTSGLTVIGVGITNQRETTLVWNRNTGKAIYNAIVWQDRRTANICRTLKTQFDEDKLTAKTGLLMDPYFSATKTAWILDHVGGARTLADRGELAFGTVDSFLIYRLTGHKVHATDATNASRTNMFNIHTQQWDPELLTLFNVPDSILPTVKDCADNYGVLSKDIVGEALPILGIAGDQQAAAIGQCCFKTGDIKSTYGTGCFVILNTGNTCVTSKNRLLSTVCYRINGQTTYALEGSIFIAGASVQWLRDSVGLVKDAKETEYLAKSIETTGGLYLVPAFTGMGAPYWDPDARGALHGITRDSGRAEIVRSALESVAYQTHDLLAAMTQDGISPTSLRVDGGMVVNNWFTQFLSDIVDIPIIRPAVMETTALGVAMLVALKTGYYKNLEDVAANWRQDAIFKPDINTDKRTQLLSGWHNAVKRTLSNYPSQ